MAKLALKLRDQKRRKTVEKFKARRAQLLEIIYDQRASDEARRRRATSCRSCRATPPRCGCATAAR
jgi:hypothetical protein